MSTEATTRSRAAEDRSARIAVSIFPLLVLAAAVIGFLAPDTTRQLVPQVNLFLGIIMFGMGLTLTWPDFALVFKRPLPIVLGVVAQYVIMPLLGLGVAAALDLPPALAAGVILVGSAPGGTASNVVAYLARADTALSVTMTSVSTLLAPLLTPLLTLWLAGQYMDVDAGSMAMSIVKIVLLPVLGGLIVRMLLRRLVDSVLPALPWVSVVFIALVVAAVVGNSAETVLSYEGITVELEFRRGDDGRWGVGEVSYVPTVVTPYQAFPVRVAPVSTLMGRAGDGAEGDAERARLDAALERTRGAIFSRGLDPQLIREK